MLIKYVTYPHPVKDTGLQIKKKEPKIYFSGSFTLHFIFYSHSMVAGGLDVIS